MNATRAFGILALGVAIGVGIGLAIPGLVGPPRDASRASSGRNTGLPVAPRLELEGEIARERSSRMKAEAERDKLEKDLAAARARLGNASESKGPPGPGALAPVASQAAALAKAPLTHPADILARVREIEGEAEDALKTRDMKKLLALIKEAASLGKDGWPVAIKLGSALMKSWEGQDTPFENQDYTETNVVLCSKEIAPLYEHAITSAETDPDFRRLAASYFRLTGAAGMMGDDPERVSVIISQLRKEQDESVASILAYNIPRETRFADGAAAVLQEQKSQNVRLVVGDVLADTPGDDVTKALAKLASTEADPTVKRLLELGLESRKQQPVSGFFLTYVAPKSQGETVGLRDGDIITTYNGVRIRAFEDLWKLNMKYTDTVPIVIYRAGATQQLTVTGTLQALGVLGRMVHSD